MTSGTARRRAFLTACGWDDAAATPLPADASFRHYTRLRRGAATAMLMEASSPAENVAAFAAVTRHLQSIGVRVPAIYVEDSAAGLLLIEDLGDETFTRLLAAGADETALYRHAVALLAHIHCHPRATAMELPRYQGAVALDEVALLAKWYVPARRGAALGAAAVAALGHAWEEIFAALESTPGATPGLPPTLVLRDYHVDNLMLSAGQCAVLDYQDAVIGSPAYDVVSLLEDARRDVDGALAAAMRAYYARLVPQVAPQVLDRHCTVWGAQRHCKVAGIFTRLWLRDGKDQYLRHLPRVMTMLGRHLDAPLLRPLRRWLDEHLGETAHVPFSAPRATLLRHCERSGRP